MAPAHLELDRIRLGYTGPDGTMHPVVHDLSMMLAQGQIGCLLGHSGCGKTTVLRAICGFEPLLAGRIVLHGAEVADARRSVAPEKRRVGVMFQDYALFPHLDVSDNIGFGLRRRVRAERAARVDELLRLVGLSAAARKYPHELSGGQQQRVALARALAPAPELLLLDEPFSSLDVDLRERLACEVRDILKDAGATALMVTHDQAEAFAMADAIGVMDRGTIVQWDDAYTLYHRPGNAFVAGFIGAGTLLPGQVEADAGWVGFELGRIRGHIPDAAPSQPVQVLLRPGDVAVDGAGPIRGQLVAKVFHGPDYLYTLRLPSGRQITAHASRHAGDAVGDTLGLRLQADRLPAFPDPA